MQVHTDFPKGSHRIEDDRAIIPSDESLGIYISFDSTNHNRIVVSVNGEEVETDSITGESEWAIRFSGNQPGEYTVIVDVYGNPTEETEFEHLERLKEQDALEMDISDSIQALNIDVVVVDSQEIHQSWFQKIKSIITDIVTAISIVMFARKFAHWLQDETEPEDELKQEKTESEFVVTTLEDFSENKPSRDDEDQCGDV